MPLLPVLALGIGLLLIWAGVTNRNPIEVVQAVVRGEDIPPVGSLTVGTSTVEDPVED